MARTGDGGGRLVRRRGSCHATLPIPDPGNDYHSYFGNSERDSLCTENDDIEIQKRDTVLDDALFGFFRKQAVKSLKRNFSDFCKNVSTSPKAKLNNTEGVSRNFFSRYSLKYFVEVIKKLTPFQKYVITKFGFGCLLLLDLHDIPSEFARWVADCIDPVCSQITVGYRNVDISKNTFHLVLGLPIGGLEVPCSSNDGKDFILSHFELSEMPHITFFGNKLCGSEELSEHDVFVCFMSIAISCFLCPTLREFPNSKYLSVLRFPEATSGYDFSKLVYDCCLESISQFVFDGKLKGRRLKTPICCNYVPVVHYLDCLDFGRKIVDQSLPRITVWKGNMIRVFSELDRKRRHQYGKRQLKEGLASCRAQGVLCNDSLSRKLNSPIFDPPPYGFREQVHNKFLNNLRPDVIDGILNTVDTFVSKNSSRKPKIETLVNDVLAFLCKARSTPVSLYSNVDDKKMKGLASTLCEKSAAVKQRGDQVMQPVQKGNTTDPATPDCLITKVVDGHGLMTAPALNPIKKFKSRRWNVMSAEEEAKISQQVHSPSFNNKCGPSHVVFSPIAHIILPDSPCVEQPGTKAAPIVVHEFSAKPNVNASIANIQLVGSYEFRKSSVELAKKVDVTYNKLLSAKHVKIGAAPDSFQHVQSEAQFHNIEERLPSWRSNYGLVNYLMTCLDPPLQQNVRFPVSDEDIINYSAIVELGHNAQHKKTLGVKYPEVHCNYQSLGESLMPFGEIDNFLIPCFCRMLFKEKHPTSSGRHYFFPHVGEAILKHNVYPNEVLIRTSFLGAAKASRNRNLGCKGNRLFFPIVDSHHWFGLAVDFEFKVFAFIDSFNTKDSDFLQRMKDTLVDNFVHLWELIISQDHDFANFRVMFPHIPKQQTLVDCGVFLMKCMEIWKPFLDMRKFFSNKDILNIRIQYAIKLYFQSENEADLSLVLDFYGKC